MASTQVTSVFSSGEILKSPGFATKVIDESQYPTATENVGSVPLVVMVTAENKAYNNAIAAGTQKTNANKLIQVNSRKHLNSLFGTPAFYTSNSEPIHGFELNEYGLFAAESAFDAAKRAFVIRADINTTDLRAGKRPDTPVETGKIWLNTNDSKWGINEWDAANNRFVEVKPTVRFGGANSKPFVGDIKKGTYVVYITGLGEDSVLNPIKISYYVVGDNSVPLLLGSPEWTRSIPTITSETVSLSDGGLSSSNAENTNIFTIEHWGWLNTAYSSRNQKYEIAITSSDTVNSIINKINTEVNALGMTAKFVSNQIRIFFNGSSAVTGQFLKVESSLVSTSTSGTKVIIKSGNYGIPSVYSGDVQPNLSLASNDGYISVYNMYTTNVVGGVTVEKGDQLYLDSKNNKKKTTYANNTSMTFKDPRDTNVNRVIQVRPVNTFKVPSKSIWIKTNIAGSVGDNSTMGLSVNKKFATGFSRQPIRQFASLQEATYALDPTDGGLNIPKDTVIQLLPKRSTLNYSTTQLLKRAGYTTVLQCENVIDGNVIKFNQSGKLYVRVTYPNNKDFNAGYVLDMSKLQLPDAEGFKQLWDETMLDGTYRIDPVTKQIVLSATTKDDVYDYLKDVVALTVEDGKLKFEHRYGGDFDFRDVEVNGTQYNIISVFGIPRTALNVHTGDFVQYHASFTDIALGRLLGENPATVVLGAYDGVLQPIATGGGEYGRASGAYMPYTTTITRHGGGYNVGDYIEIDETGVTSERNVSTSTTGNVFTLKNVPRTFKLADFFGSPNVTIDADIQFIRIKSLPTKGALTYSEEYVTVDQLIPVSGLNNLKFTPVDGEYGYKYTSFTYVGERVAPTTDKVLKTTLVGDKDVLLSRSHVWLGDGSTPIPANVATIIIKSVSDGAFLQYKTADGWVTVDALDGGFPYEAEISMFDNGNLRVTQPDGTPVENIIDAVVTYTHRLFAWSEETATIVNKTLNWTDANPDGTRPKRQLTLELIGSGTSTGDADDVYFKIYKNTTDTDVANFTYMKSGVAVAFQATKDVPLIVSKYDIVNGLVYWDANVSSVNINTTKLARKSINIKFYERVNSNTFTIDKHTALTPYFPLKNVKDQLFPIQLGVTTIRISNAGFFGTCKTKPVSSTSKDKLANQVLQLFKKVGNTYEPQVVEASHTIKYSEIDQYFVARRTDHPTVDVTDTTSFYAQISYEGKDTASFRNESMYVNVNESSNNIKVRVTKIGNYTLFDVGSDSALTSPNYTGSSSGVFGIAIDSSSSINVPIMTRVHVSNWERFDYVASPSEPKYYPADGKLWYSGDFTDLDIMVNTPDGWKGYGQVDYDRFGNPTTVYENGSTDALVDNNGPIYSRTPPKRQSDGISPLRFGDLWVDTNDMENFPVIRRWRDVDGVAQWASIGTTDSDITSNDNLAPVKYADMRWSYDNTVDPVFDPVPSVKAMWNRDGVDLDAPISEDYAVGTIMINTRRSGMTVKKFASNYFIESKYPVTTEKYTEYINKVANATQSGKTFHASTWVTTSGFDNSGRAYMGRHAQRSVIVDAMKYAIENCKELYDEYYQFNLLAAPGYPELQQSLVDLNRARGEIGYVIGDTPLRLVETPEDITAWATNANRETGTNERGMVTKDSYLGVFYPALLATDSSGKDVVVPASHGVLRQYLMNDNQLAYPWCAVAGINRGVIGAEQNGTIGGQIKEIGYIDKTGAFQKTHVRNAIRDVLYVNNINPITNLSGHGITIFGNKNTLDTQSAMDRANVSRLDGYIRDQLPKLLRKYLYEPNDVMTRTQVTNVVQSMLMDLLVKRGVYDFLVKCDEENNPPAVIDNNELWVDIAIEPAKAVEFVYIPIRLKNTGELSAA